MKKLEIMLQVGDEIFKTYDEVTVKLNNGKTISGRILPITSTYNFSIDAKEGTVLVYPSDIKKILKKEYSFGCNMSEEFKTYDCHDEWGCATLWLNKEQGVEYNFCMDHGHNSSAIYKMEYNEETDMVDTDYSTCEHYEIDFSQTNWQKELEKAMHKAALSFFK